MTKPNNNLNKISTSEDNVEELSSTRIYRFMLGLSNRNRIIANSLIVTGVIVPAMFFTAACDTPSAQIQEADQEQPPSPEESADEGLEKVVVLKEWDDGAIDMKIIGVHEREDAIGQRVESGMDGNLWIGEESYRFWDGDEDGILQEENVAENPYVPDELPDWVKNSGA